MMMSPTLTINFAQAGEKPGESSVVTKWENITAAMEPFQVEPSLDPGTQYLVPRMETLELDGAIADLNSQIGDLEVGTVPTITSLYAKLCATLIDRQEAFSWRTKAGEELLDKDVDMTPFDHPLFATIDERLKEIEVRFTQTVAAFELQAIAMAMYRAALSCIPVMTSDLIINTKIDRHTITYIYYSAFLITMPAGNS